MIRIILISSGRYDCNHILLFKSVLILHRISKQKSEQYEKSKLDHFRSYFAGFLRCGGSTSASDQNKETPATVASDGTNPSYDPHRGEGKFTKVDIGATLDASMADAGKKYSM